jgi:CheY-like chemotaxis protein
VKRKVMVVDCEYDLTYSIKRTLEDTGLFEVDSFNNSAQALSSFARNPYDLVILDIRMREMDGFELYRKIKMQNRKVKVCFLSSVFEFRPYTAIYPDMMETVGKNGDRIIDKPVGSERLIGEVRKLIISK